MKLECEQPYCNYIEVLQRDVEKTIYRMNCGDGDGIMVCYPVFDGVELYYNDFQAFRCSEPGNRPGSNFLEINHCRKGRYECRFGKNHFAYLSEGDLAITGWDFPCDASRFPLGYYNGIEILIDIAHAQEHLSCVLEGIEIDLDRLRQKLSGNDGCFVLRATKEIEHIFDELYHVDPRIQKGYFRIKVLELLLFLSITPFESGRDRRQYLLARQACVVEQIHDVLTKNLDQNITLEALSKRFDIGMTTMKNCFRAVYGKPINTWRREYRLHVAARMLRETDKSVLEIANSVGYENPSKFADAFRKQLGIPPLEYRKNN